MRFSIIFHLLVNDISCYRVTQNITIPLIIMYVDDITVYPRYFPIVYNLNFCGWDMLNRIPQFIRTLKCESMNVT